MDIFLHGRDPHGEVAKACNITRKQAKCVNENTLIFTDKGVLRIGEVSACRLKDTFDSPMISFVFNGSGMIGVNSFYSNGYDSTLGIITKRGIVRSSINHQYVMADGTLKRAGDLKIGDEVVAIFKSSNVLVTTDITLNISARNKFQGEIEKITKGDINSEVVLNIGNSDKIAAVITSDSIENLKLKKGEKLSAIIKASDVMIGK